MARKNKISAEARDIVNKHRTVTNFGYTIDSDQMIAAAQELREASEKKQQQNADAIEQLNQKIDSIQQQMEQYKDTDAAARKLNSWYESNRRDAWKTVAKDLGIHKYLTGNGAMSRAKLSSKPQDEIQSVLDTYNNKYVGEVNQLVDKIHGEYNTKISQYREDMDKHNQLAREHNRLVQQLNQLSTV